MLTGRQKIISLQALRALAFLGIFFQHAKFFVQWAFLGVSVFYVMSGFLMMYGYGNKELLPSIKFNADFSLKRIKKLYPLHILTMMFAIILNVVIIMYIQGGFTLSKVMVLLGQTALHTTLMQTWFPYGCLSSLNGVAWYLSVTMFLYFVFPWLQAFVRKSQKHNLCVISCAILCAQIALCIPFIHYLGINNPVYIWFMYCFPVFRLGDFFVGCALERVYFEGNLSSVNSIKASVYEILAFVLTVLVILWVEKAQNNVILLALKNWTTIYIPLAAIWVYLFVLNKGLITKTFTNRLFIFLGNISAYLFLIHQLVTRCFMYVTDFFDLDVNGIFRAVLVGVELITSVLLSIGYKKIHDAGLLVNMIPFFRMKNRLE